MTSARSSRWNDLPPPILIASVNVLVVLLVGVSLTIGQALSRDLSNDIKKQQEVQTTAADETQRALFLLDCIVVAGRKFEPLASVNRPEVYNAWVDECFRLNGVHPSTAIKLPPDPA